MIRGDCCFEIVSWETPIDVTDIDNQTFFQELEWLAALLVFKLAHQNPLYCVYSVVQQYFI